jgi:hypothetical protein
MFKNEQFIKKSNDFFYSVNNCVLMVLNVKKNIKNINIKLTLGIWQLHNFAATSVHLKFI